MRAALGMVPRWLMPQANAVFLSTGTGRLVGYSNELREQLYTAFRWAHGPASPAASGGHANPCLRRTYRRTRAQPARPPTHLPDSISYTTQPKLYMSCIARSGGCSMSLGPLRPIFQVESCTFGMLTLRYNGHPLPGCLWLTVLSVIRVL